MADTTRLKLYNDALILCRDTQLASLTETGKRRSLLDQVWDSNGVRACLEAGQWQFAMRTQQLDYDPDIEPPFGYRRAFNKPTDWVATSAVCTDEFFKQPLLNYADELDQWFADLETIYVKFVSDDPDYGTNLAIWPQSFADYVAAFFASKIVMPLTSDKQIWQAILDPRKGLLAQALSKAKNKAAMTQPTQFPPPGAWVSSRRGRGSRTRNDGGNSGSLIG